MHNAHAPSRTVVSRIHHGGGALMVFFLGLLAGGARAEQLGTYPHRNGIVHLMSDLCDQRGPNGGQRVRQTVGGRERHGCWGIDRAGNPVVTWSDGSELVLDGEKVRPALRMPALPGEGVGAAAPRWSKAQASPQTARPRAEVPPAAASQPPWSAPAAQQDFVRPVWCPDAGFPHERLVCNDAELADRDLRLGSLWRAYRRTLSRDAEAWHKSDYFRRLKACGADKDCIVSEQETQMRRYSHARSSPG